MGESHRVGMSYRNGISRDYDYDVDSDGTLDGLDAFGRVTDISFEHDVNGQALYYQYGYDKRGNKQFARVEHQGADRSWLYEYDDLNRLVRASRGELNVAGDGFEGGTPETTRWYLDPLGNWSDGDSDRSVVWFDDADGDGQWDEDADGTWDQDDDPLRQSVHHDSNSVNQIESRTEGDGGGTEPPIDFAYDAAGNLTFDGRQYYVYDAWNRLVAVYEPGTLTVDQYGDLQGIPGSCISRYEYDALNRRVQTIERPDAPDQRKTMHVYGGGAQVLAEYDVTEGEAGPLARWFVHGESFPDPLVMVDLTAAGDQPAGISEYLYYLKDALGSVGALSNEAGEVVERYIYDPYGNTTVLRPDGTSSLPTVPVGYYFDADLDLTITLADYDHLLACSATPGDPICVFAHDYNRSGTVDGDDVGTFEAFLNDLPMPAPEPWRREVRAKLDADGALAGSDASVPILDLFDFDGLEICFAEPDALCLQLYDIDNDGTLTLSDEYAAFVSYFTGPNPSDGPLEGSSRFGNPFLWTGQRYEPATGLYHFLYRSYGPNLGRWLQKDPMGVLETGGGAAGLQSASDSPWVFAIDSGAGAEYSDGMSQYTYAASAPATSIDPDGRATMLIRRDWDNIWESILGHRSAYLGSQGGATFGGFWGGNFAAAPRFASGMAGISQGMSAFADYYADQVMWLPVDMALAGFHAGAFAQVVGVAQDAKIVASGSSKFFTYSAGTAAFASRVISGVDKFADARRIARNFTIPWKRWRHILKFHHWGSLFKNKGRFLPGANIKGMIRAALQSTNSLIKDNLHAVGGWVFELKFPAVIGLTRAGRPAYIIRVILTPAGKVWTAFPV